MEQRIQAAAEAEGFDPSVIIAIITSIMQLFAGCNKPPKPAEVLADAQAGNLRAKFAVHRAMRENGIHPLKPDGRKTEAFILSQAKAMTEPEVAEMMANAGA